MADPYLTAKLPVIEAQIDAWMAAQLAFATDEGVVDYTIDTGQTKTRVLRSDAAVIQKTIDGLLNQREIIRNRCGLGSGSYIARPAF